MATNLVSEIAEALGPTIVTRIASALGLGGVIHPEGGKCRCARSSCCAHLARFQASRRK